MRLFWQTGAFSATWILLWYLKYRRPGDHSKLGRAELRHIEQGLAEVSGPSTPWIQLLGYRQTWAFAIAKFLTDPIWWFYLFWLPSYFSQRYHLDLSHLGLPLIIVYNATTIGSIGGGWLPRPSAGWDSRTPSRGWWQCYSAPVWLFPFSPSTISIRSG